MLTPRVLQRPIRRREDKIGEKASDFFGDAQSAWYTVGYKMAVIVEKRFGRTILIDCVLDPREFAGPLQSGRKRTQRSWRRKVGALVS